MIRVQVPATSANCCVGFDCLGVALDWFATFTFEKSDCLKVTGCPSVYQNEDNLVVLAFKKACECMKVKFPTFHLHIDSTIPFARGLGSSATCIVGGLMAANSWFDQPLNMSDLLILATEMEGHPDNVAPALFGGMVACFMDGNSIYSQKVQSVDWKGVAMIPSYPISTHEARKVLPSTIAYGQACKQVGHALVFMKAYQTGDEELLAKSCVDFLHEPYRKKMIVEYDRICEFCQLRAIPMWISGSGSTMLALSKREDILDDLRSFICSWSDMMCKEVKVSKKGAIVTYV